LGGTTGWSRVHKFRGEELQGHGAGTLVAAGAVGEGVGGAADPLLLACNGREDIGCEDGGTWSVGSAGTVGSRRRFLIEGDRATRDGTAVAVTESVCGLAAPPALALHVGADEGSDGGRYQFLTVGVASA
jgi:hypothetical protein